MAHIIVVNNTGFYEVNPNNVLQAPLISPNLRPLIGLYDIIVTLTVTGPPTPIVAVTDWLCCSIVTNDNAAIYEVMWNVNLNGPGSNLTLRFPWQNNLPCTVSVFFTREYIKFNGNTIYTTSGITTVNATPNAAESAVPDISGTAPTFTASFPSVNDGIPSI
jgi:hypothetical protein